MVKLTKEKLNKYASRGYDIAFKNKSNADKYKGLLRKHNRKYQTIRSTGPSIENKRKKSLTYYVHVGRKINIKKVRLNKRFGGTGLRVRVRKR